MPVSKSTLSEIDSALKEYVRAVLASELSASSQAVYIDHASNFVRWLKGEFDPGSRVNPHPLKRKRAARS
jgi:DNA polymerase II small subunit/DNA polymerase delta subunit B